VLRIEPTTFHQPKTEGDVDVDEELLELFREMKSRTLGNFVLESPSHVQPKPGTLQHYRCASLFDKVVAWLRAKGLGLEKVEKPLHELRKEFGSLVADQHGIYAAARALRDTVQTAEAHYLDKKTRKTVGLGTLLKSAPVPAEPKIIEGTF
jgi:hypothetical protein